MRWTPPSIVPASQCATLVLADHKACMSLSHLRKKEASIYVLAFASPFLAGSTSLFLNKSIQPFPRPLFPLFVRNSVSGNGLVKHLNQLVTTITVRPPCVQLYELINFRLYGPGLFAFIWNYHVSTQWLVVEQRVHECF